MLVPAQLVHMVRFKCSECLQSDLCLSLPLKVGSPGDTQFQLQLVLLSCCLDVRQSDRDVGVEVGSIETAGRGELRTCSLYKVAALNAATVVL